MDAHRLGEFAMRSLFLTAAAAIVVFYLPGMGRAQDDTKLHHRYLLTSAESNRRVGPFRLTQDDLPRVGPGPWSVRQFVLRGGKQEGVELIRIYNGKLRITVVPTRGLSVLDVGMGDLRLGWNS